MNLAEYLSVIPKAELHLHLEGAVQPEDLLRLAQKNKINIGMDTVESVSSLYSYNSFDSFKKILLLGVRVIREPEDLYYLMQRLGSALELQNIRYAEIFWTPQLYRHLGSGYEALFTALSSAASEIHTRTGIRINWIPDIVRNRAEFAWEVMEWATQESSLSRGVVALGLAGVENSLPASRFTEVFKVARQRGLPANPHAGEGTSPTHIRDVLVNLAPGRIGHGISATADPELMAELGLRKITLEICPTSNLKLGLCKDYQSHPLLSLVNAGCRVCINTDDPALFMTDLSTEYWHAVVDCGLSLGQLEQTSLNSITASYLPETDKQLLLNEFSGAHRKYRGQLDGLHTTVPADHQSPVEIRSTAIASSNGHITATDLYQEQRCQHLWRLKPRYSRMKLFEQLVKNEFLEPEVIQAGQSGSLRQLIRYAASNVPYYQDLLETRRLRPRDFITIDDLKRLPIMDKQQVRANQASLRTKSLPAGEKIFGSLSSSGTTGRPVKVLQTVRNNTLFHILNQRHYRWYRLDPAASLAFIRLASQLPPGKDRQYCRDGDTVRLPGWRYAGTFFQTGPWMGFNITNPVEQQLQWLQQERPQYLGSYAESLEHLCFASNGQIAVDTIRATLAVSEQLTTSMRGRIEHGFNAPVHQGYGLGEIGMVAIECDAGRFHVHTEHCIVEIVDAEGNPCKPGDVGRIVVTALNNYAMPLIRYDTDDLAQVVDGPCPCGRTLPAFGKISGRYSRIAFLPEGTLPLVAAIRTVIDTMPDAVAQNFRRYQLHQYRDNRFELRLVTSGELTEEFHTLIRSSWQQACGNSLIELDIKIVPELSRTAGGKNLEFTSDFMPAPD